MYSLNLELKLALQQQPIILQIKIKSRKSKAFNEIYQQYNYLVSLENERNIKGDFIDKYLVVSLFNERNDLINGLYLCLIMIMLFSDVFSKEYSSGAIKLIQSGKERNKSFIYKYIISSLIIVAIFIAVFLPKYINIFDEYGRSFLNAPIQSIEEYLNFSINMDVFHFIILNNLLKLFGVLSIGIIIMAISIVMKNKIITMLLATLLLIPSILLKLFGIDLIALLSLTNIFDG